MQSSVPIVFLFLSATVLRKGSTAPTISSADSDQSAASETGCYHTVNAVLVPGHGADRRDACATAELQRINGNVCGKREQLCDKLDGLLKNYNNLETAEEASDLFRLIQAYVSPVQK